MGQLETSHGTVGNVSCIHVKHTTGGFFLDHWRQLVEPLETSYWRCEMPRWTTGNVLFDWTIRDILLDHWRRLLDCFNSITVRLVISTSTMGMWKVVKLVFHSLGGGVGKGRLC